MNGREKVYIELTITALKVIIGRLPNKMGVFLNDGILQDATLMRLQEAGEHLVQLRERCRDYYEQHQTESWHKLIGLRNIISHGYAQVELEKVWGVVTVDVPKLLAELIEL